MPIDPNIILQAGRVKPLDYGELASTALGQIGQQQQIAYQRSQMQANERQQAAAERKEVAMERVGALAAGGDMAGARKEAFGAGDFDIVTQLDKMDEASVARLKSIAEGTAPIIATLGKIPRGEARRAAFQEAAPMLEANGYKPEQIAQLAGQIDNDGFLQLAVANGMKIADYQREQKDLRDFGFSQDKFRYQQTNDAQGRAIQLGQLALTRRGQDMTDARAREAARTTGTTANAKPLTEDQGKSTGNYMVMRRAAETFGQIRGYDPTVVANALDKGDLSGTQLSQVDRRALNAQRAFVVAALRAESGATYGPSEVVDKIRVLFPTPGDGADVLADKAKLRGDYLASLRARSGTGTSAIPRLVAPAAIPTIRDNADYAKLKSGTTFIAPDGSRRVKP